MLSMLCFSPKARFYICWVSSLGLCVPFNPAVPNWPLPSQSISTGGPHRQWVGGGERLQSSCSCSHLYHEQVTWEGWEKKGEGNVRNWKYSRSCRYPQVHGVCRAALEPLNEWAYLAWLSEASACVSQGCSSMVTLTCHSHVKYNQERQSGGEQIKKGTGRWKRCINGKEGGREAAAFEIIPLFQKCYVCWAVLYLATANVLFHDIILTISHTSPCLCVNA